MRSLPSESRVSASTFCTPVYLVVMTKLAATDAAAADDAQCVTSFANTHVRGQVDCRGVRSTDSSPRRLKSASVEIVMNIFISPVR